jgi:probable F420-dependent oxidoreductase
MVKAPPRVRIGAAGSAFGPEGLDIADQAVRCEAAGFDSFWIGDHVVSPHTIRSRYPYAADGEIPWTPQTPMYDAVVSAAFAAAATERIEIAFGVLVIPLRHPIVTAKQLATLDRLSNGRIALGCGAGWLAEEFEALNEDYRSRMSRMSEWISIFRACWTGDPGLLDGDHYRLQVETSCYPVPAHPIPILVGGVSERSLELAGTLADGWYPILTEDRLDRSWLTEKLDRIRSYAETSGKDPETLRFTACIEADSKVIAKSLDMMSDLGIEEVVVGVDWSDDDAPELVIRMLQSAFVSQADESVDG